MYSKRKWLMAWLKTLFYGDPIHLPPGKLRSKWRIDREKLFREIDASIADNAYPKEPIIVQTGDYSDSDVNDAIREYYAKGWISTWRANSGGGHHLKLEPVIG